MYDLPGYSNSGVPKSLLDKHWAVEFFDHCQPEFHIYAAIAVPLAPSLRKSLSFCESGTSQYVAHEREYWNCQIIPRGRETESHKCHLQQRAGSTPIAWQLQLHLTHRLIGRLSS